MSAFYDDATEAGFTPDQARFLDECLAKHPHTHDVDDIVGLEEALDDAGVEIGEEEDEE